MKLFIKLVACILSCELAGFISIPWTITAIPQWYQYLNKPSFSPPNWIFGPVWTTLYCLMGIAVFLIWQKGLKKKAVRKAITYFLIQLFFNALWSIVFFGFRSPILGLLDILLLFSFLALSVLSFYTISKQAAYLLIPYLFWVSFATVLNAGIVMLNPS